MIPMRDVNPYRSIRLRVPEDWNEDATSPESCYYYYPGQAGPPSLYIRRDDFLYGQAGKDEVQKCIDLHDIQKMDAAMFEKFKTLASSMNVPDMHQLSVEPLSTQGQLIRYQRFGLIGDQAAIAWWWVRGIRTGGSFTVVSISLEILAEQADSQESRCWINLLDQEACNISILPLAEAAHISHLTQKRDKVDHGDNSRSAG